MKFTKNPTYSYLDLSNCIRILTIDSIERAKSGHPGMPLGMADIMTILAFKFLKFNPSEPSWFSRDRLVLSNGHGSMLLYSFYYLTGYTDFDIIDLKNFRQLGSKTSGHPEHELYSAVETTTGPLGQGLATSVGIAIACKKYQQHIKSNHYAPKIYCLVGDGCLMEGISYESASLAGHLGLNNLIVLFDDNKISIDGSTTLTVSEDHIKKFTSLGWEVDSIDGHDFQQIELALQKAQNSSKPYFIACRTQIAKGAPNKVNTAEAHGMPLGRDEVKAFKQIIGVSDEDFHIPEHLLQIWRSAWLRNESNYQEWQQEFAHMSVDSKNYITAHSIDAQHLSSYKVTQSNEATRVSSGRIIEEMLKHSNKIICGSADLSTSNGLKNEQNKIINKDDFSGNFIHYGIRENAMAAIMNGLALSGFLPIGGSFLVFSDYMKPSIRLSALMQLQVIYVMTHDSIGVGEDGPTHQPIEQLASFRSLPNLLLMRPADAIETLECWQVALMNTIRPSMIVLTRQNVTQIRKAISKDNLSSCGAYDIEHNYFLMQASEVFDVSIFASGSEVEIAIEVAKILRTHNLKIKVISVPCFELFFAQDQDYIKYILGTTQLKVAIEAACSFGWHRIIGEEGMFFGVEEFGKSAPKESLYEYFGLTAVNIAKQIKSKVKLDISNTSHNQQ
ncbi:MAG: transketolase [Rickettsiaceae bacterium]|nr:MAG: transketolase [Rickettsiaceae bacterium]